MQTAIPINRTILQFCNLTAAELMGRVQVLDNYFGSAVLARVLQRGVRDIGTVSLLCERSVVAERLASTSGFQQIAGDIACEPDISLSAPGDRWFQLGLGYILTTLGERIVFGGMDNTRGTILLRDGRLNLECRSSLVDKTLRDVFTGHRQICDVLNSRGCKGRWMIHIDRHYYDGDPIRELIGMLRHTAVEDIPATTWPGISITATDEDYPGRTNRSMEMLTTDEKRDPFRYPRSLLINDGLSLWLEGPYFDQYAFMEEIIVEAGDRDGGCRLIAIDTDEFAGGTDILKERLEFVFRSQSLVNISAVLLVQTEREERGAAFTIEVLANPDSAWPVPEDFTCAVEGRHRIFY